MRRLTKTEKAAAAAVLGMTISVAGAGISLIRKHTKYWAQKAASAFKDDEQDEASAEAESGEQDTVE